MMFPSRTRRIMEFSVSSGSNFSIIRQRKVVSGKVDWSSFWLIFRPSSGHAREWALDYCLGFPTNYCGLRGNSEQRVCSRVTHALKFMTTRKVPVGWVNLSRDTGRAPAIFLRGFCMRRTLRTYILVRCNRFLVLSFHRPCAIWRLNMFD